MGFIRWGGKKYYPQKPKPYQADINELMKPLSEKVNKGNVWGSQIMNVQKGDAVPSPTPTPTPTPTPINLGITLSVNQGTDDYEISTDGENWTGGTLTASASWGGGAYGNGRFLIGIDSRNTSPTIQRFSYSTDGAETWSALKGPSTSSRATDIVYSNYLNRFYSAGYENATSYFTTDGETYTTYTKPSQYIAFIGCDEDNELLIFGNRFVSPFIIRTSYSGGTGTFVNRQTTTTGICCIIRNSTLSKSVAFCLNSVYYISTDSINWSGYTNTSLSAATNFPGPYGAAYRPSDGRTLLVLDVDANREYSYSDDLINWTSGVLPGSGTYEAIIYNQPLGKWITSDSDGNYALSSDGINWTYETGTGTNTDVRALIHGY
jgi:hypothetical protein